MSPFFLLFNREVVVPIDNLLKPRHKYQGEEPHKIALEQQHKAFLLVHQNRRKAMKKRNQNINSKAKDVTLKIGDPVYYRNHARKSKLDPKWQPYYPILEQTSPVTFVIKNQLDGSTVKVHAQHLRYADINEWELPKDKTGKRLRPSNYVVPPNTSSSSESDSDLGHCPKRRGYVTERYRRARSDSSSEDDIPLAELRDKIRSRQNWINEEDKHIPIDSGDSIESYFTGPEDMDVNDIYSLISNISRSKYEKKNTQRLQKVRTWSYYNA